MMFYQEGAGSMNEEVCQRIPKEDDQSTIHLLRMAANSWIGTLWIPSAEQGERAIALCYKKLDSSEVSLEDDGRMMARKSAHRFGYRSYQARRTRDVQSPKSRT